MKKYSASVGMVISKKSAIQLSVEAPLPQSLQDIPRFDVTTNKYQMFEMKKGEIEGKEMMDKLEERIEDRQEEPTRRVEMFMSRNWIQLREQECDECGPVLQWTRQVHPRWLDRWTEPSAST